MSATATDAAARTLPTDSELHHPEPRKVVLVQRLVTLTAVLTLLLGIWISWSSLAHSALWMIPWLMLVAAAELLPVMYMHEVNLTLSMPYCSRSA
jgi:hypothetical protein